MSTTSIEWTDKTWGPVVGCTRKSPGCLHCYAETMAGRLVPMAAAKGRRSVYLRVVQPGTFQWSRPADVKRDPEHHRHVELLPERLAEPLSFRAGTRVFVCSMSDLFHEDVPFGYIAQVWGVMAATPGVTYQVLTKRPERLLEFFAYLAERPWRGALATPPFTPAPAGPLPNVWLGTSVEDQQRADERIPHLLAAPAAVRFLSVEPLLGPVDLGRWIRRIDHCNECEAENGPQIKDECPGCGATGCLITTYGEEQAERYRTGERYTTPAGQIDTEGKNPRIDWVIVGGESGPKSRPMDELLAPADPLPGGALVRSLRDQCKEGDVAFFFKQWGGVKKKKNGRDLDGRTHDAMPEVSRA